MRKIREFSRVLSLYSLCAAALFLTGCAATYQYPPFPDQAKKVEDPSKARIYVIRPAKVIMGGVPLIFYGTDWAATGPVFDPDQKLILPLFGVLPDNYSKDVHLRRIGEIGPHSYICWETLPHVFLLQRIEGDAKTTFSIDLKAGNVYYFRASTRPGWIANKSIIEMVSEPEGLALLKGAHPPRDYTRITTQSSK